MIETKRHATSDSAVGIGDASFARSEKPRGFLNFMTRPLFLAQIFFADQALGGLIRPAAAEDTPTSDTAPPQDARGADAPDSATSPLQIMAEDEGQSGSRESNVADAARSDSAVSGTATSAPEIVVTSLTGGAVGVAGSGGGGDGGSGLFESADGLFEPGSTNAEVGGVVAGSDPGQSRVPDAILSGSAATLSSNAGDIRGALTSVESHDDPIGAIPGSTTGMVSDAAGGVVTVVEPLADSAVPPLASVISTTTGVVGDFVAAVEPIVDSAVPTLPSTTDAVTGAVDAVATVAEAVVDSVGPTLASAGNVATSAADGVLTAAEPIVDSVGPTVASAGNVATSAADGVLTAAEPIVDSVGPTVASAGNVATSAVDGVSTAADPIVDFVGPTLASATNAVTGAVDGVATVAEPVVDTIAPASDVTSAAESVADSIMPTVASAVTATDTDVVTVADSIVASVADGAIDVAPSVMTEPIVASVAPTQAFDVSSAPAITSDGPTADSTVVSAVDAAIDVAPSVMAEPIVTSVAPTLASIADPNGGDVSTVSVGPAAPTLAVPDAVSAPLDMASDFNQPVVEATPSVLDPIVAATENDAAAPQPPVLSADSAVNELAEAASHQSASDFLSSDGAITLADQPPLAASVDDLFSKGSFTDYGVALTGAPPDSGDSQALDPKDAETTLAKDSPDVESDRDHAPTSRDDALHANPTPVVAEFTNALDEQLLRGVDGLI